MIIYLVIKITLYNKNCVPYTVIYRNLVPILRVTSLFGSPFSWTRGSTVLNTFKMYSFSCFSSIHDTGFPPSLQINAAWRTFCRCRHFISVFSFPAALLVAYSSISPVMIHDINRLVSCQYIGFLCSGLLWNDVDSADHRSWQFGSRQSQCPKLLYSSSVKFHLVDECADLLLQSDAAGHDLITGRPRVAGWIGRVKLRLQPHFDDVHSTLYTAREKFARTQANLWRVERKRALKKVTKNARGCDLRN